jgi:hypothetical protein
LTPPAQARICETLKPLKARSGFRARINVRRGMASREVSGGSRGKTSEGCEPQECHRDETGPDGSEGSKASRG